MTDLERARAHLLYRQEALYLWRINGNDVAIRRCEHCVLAALSWVWEEQERDRKCAFLRALERIKRQKRHVEAAE